MRLGPKLGVDIGPAIGPQSNAPVVTWDVDATSGVSMPSDATQYADWRAAYSVAVAAPSLLYPCDEASGNLAPAIGAASLVGSGARAYQQVLTGWSTLGVRSSNLVSWFELTGSDLSVVDLAVFAIIKLETVAVGSLISLGGSSLATSTELGITATGALQARRGAAVAASAAPYSGVVAVLMVCRQSASDFSIYVKPVGGAMETLTPAWSAPPAAVQTFYLFNGYEASGSDARTNRVEMWAGAGANISAAQAAAFFAARGI